jgi:hypothetical protein
LFAYGDGSEAWADARRDGRPSHADWRILAVHRRWLIIGTLSGEGFQAGTELLRMIEDTRLAPVLKIPHLTVPTAEFAE